MIDWRDALKNRVIGLFVLFSVAAAVLAGFIVEPAEGTGIEFMLLYLHVPLALCATVSFAVSGLSAFRFLKKGDILMSDSSHAAARLGFMFTVLTTASGALWAEIAWGSFWNNDPRETSIAFLLVVYTAYFALRSAIGTKPGHERVSAVYLVFSAAVMPFFVFAVPRLYPSLHPDAIVNGSGSVHLTGGMRAVLGCAACAGLSLFWFMYSLEKRVAVLSRKKAGLR